MKRIESRNNPKIKSLTALKDRRGREKARLFYFEGVHLLEEYLRAGLKPLEIFVREDVTARYSQLLDKAECEIYEVTTSVYEKLSDEKAPQGLFVVSEYLPNVKILDAKTAKDIKGISVMLADLQDMGNVGTVIRTSAALDCDVILGGSCADIYSSKTVRATMGALFMNNIYLCPSVTDAIAVLKASGKRVIASALTDKAETLGKFDILPDDCFVVGNEGQGLSRETIAECSFTAIIPMSGKTESLNAANAAAILLWEAKRGRI